MATVPVSHRPAGSTMAAPLGPFHSGGASSSPAGVVPRRGLRAYARRGFKRTRRAFRFGGGFLATRRTGEDWPCAVEGTLREHNLGHRRARAVTRLRAIPLLAGLSCPSYAARASKSCRRRFGKKRARKTDHSNLQGPSPVLAAVLECGGVEGVNNAGFGGAEGDVHVRRCRPPTGSARSLSPCRRQRFYQVPRGPEVIRS